MVVGHTLAGRRLGTSVSALMSFYGRRGGGWRLKPRLGGVPPRSSPQGDAAACAGSRIRQRGHEMVQVHQPVSGWALHATRGQRRVRYTCRTIEREVLAEARSEGSEAMFQEIAAALGRGEPGALVTVVRVSGAAPCGPGARLFVHAD